MKHHYYMKLAILFSVFEERLNKCFYDNKLKKSNYFLFTGFFRDNEPFSCFFENTGEIFILIDDFHEMIEDFVHEFAHKVEYELYGKTDHRKRFHKIRKDIMEKTLCLLHQTKWKKAFKNLEIIKA